MRRTIFSEDFNTFAGVGFDADPLIGQLDADLWAVSGFSTDTDLTRGLTQGGTTTGGVYALDRLAGDRGLLIQPGGTDFTPGTLSLTLNSGESALTDVTISFDRLVNNDQDRANTFNLEYSLDGVTFTLLDSFTSTETADTFGVTSTTVTVKLPDLPANTDFVLRWSGDDVSGSGSRDEFGIDNLVIDGEDAGEAAPIVINKVLASTAGADSEFIELFGAAGASLAGLSFIGVESNSTDNNGTIDFRYDFADRDVIGDNGFLLLANQTAETTYGVTANISITDNSLENSSTTYALVQTASITGTSISGSEVAIDSVASVDGNYVDPGLGAPVVGPDGAFFPAGVARIEDGVDTDTSEDFRILDFGNSPSNNPVAGTGLDGGGDAEITLISAIQGTGGTGDLAVVGVDDRSAFEGRIVTVQAIVTADFQDGGLGSLGDLNGFYIQEEEVDYDFSDLSSEGIFIFDGSAPLVDVQIGDLVEITGTVSEFFGQTQISATIVQVIDTEQMIPTSVEVTFPTANVMLDATGNYVANLEAYEGMLVNIPQDMTVTEMFNLDRFGQYNVSADGQQVQFTQDNAPDVAGFEQHKQDVASSTIVLDDGLSAQNPDQLRIIDGNDGVLTAGDSFRMGDTISSIEGVIGYSFEEFRINAATGTYSQTNPREVAPQDTGGNFTVASLNVLNYFTTIDLFGVTTDIGADPRGADSAEEFARQADKLVTTIISIDADVLGLIEIENDFAGENFAIKDIVDRVNAELGSTVYAFVDPGQEFVGGDAIANGLIYKVDKVALSGDMAILETFDGRNFLDPLGAGRDLNRPAIAQTFEDLDTGQTLTVSVNHLKSKGSLSGLEADVAQGDGQGNNNATRTEAADILADWLNSDPTGQGSLNTLILGDLNAYAKEDPLTALADAGFTDLAAAELGNSAYSYVFDGQIGTLDYALANDALAASVVGVTEWHINSDEADALDYNLDFGRDPTLYNADSPARNSDHDPVIVSFEFEPLYNLIAGTDGVDRLFGTDGRDEIIGNRGNDIIFANGGNDLINAGPGNDKVYGGAGDDIILAGEGRRDFYFGGEGSDTFIFSSALAEDSNRDKSIIQDFNVTEDIIDLNGAVIEEVREFKDFVRIELEGGNDRIELHGVSDFDEIIFAHDLLIV